MKNDSTVKHAMVKKRTLKQIIHSLFFIMFRNYAMVVVAFAILTGLIFCLVNLILSRLILKLLLLLILSIIQFFFPLYRFLKLLKSSE